MTPADSLQLVRPANSSAADVREQRQASVRF
jgi:hypothetical protein